MGNGTDTAVPSYAPTLALPTASAKQNILDRNSWTYIIHVWDVYALIFSILLVFFEVFRRRVGYVYDSRKAATMKRAPVLGKTLYRPYKDWPIIGFVLVAIQVPDEDVIKLHGLDAYACVRFLKVCILISSCCVFGSMAVLLPSYMSAAEARRRNDADYLYVDDSRERERERFLDLTLFAGQRAIDRDDDDEASRDGDSQIRRATIWLSVVAAYFLAATVYVVVRREYRAIRDRRCEWLLQGDPDWARQALYTVVVEHLTPGLRSSVALEKHFGEALFPGSVATTTLAVTRADYTSWSWTVQRCFGSFFQRLTGGFQRTTNFVNDVTRADEICGYLGGALDEATQEARPDVESSLQNPLHVTEEVEGENEFVGSDDDDDGSESSFSEDEELDAVRQRRQQPRRRRTTESSVGDDYPAADLTRRQSAKLPVIFEELWLILIGRRQESTAFVTFKDLSTAACAARVDLSHRAFTMIARPAPEPNDVLWAHAKSPLHQRTLRHWLGDFLFVLLGVGWCSFLSWVAIYFNSPSVVKKCGSALRWAFGRAQKDDDAAAHYAAEFVAVAISLISLILVPWIAAGFAYAYEKPLTRTDVEISVFRRYTLFQFIYVYVNIFSLSFARLGKLALKAPREALELLASQIAKASGYFVSVLIIKTSFGLMWELARAWPLLSKWLAKKAFSTPAAMVAVDRPRYGWILPNVIVVSCILLTFAIITPLLTPFAWSYFAVAYVVYKHQLLYVYSPPNQMCGVFAPLLLQALMNALTGSQLILLGFYLASSEWYAASVMAPLVPATQLVAMSFRVAYHRALMAVPLNIARHIDKQIDPPLFSRDLYEPPPDDDNNAPRRLNFDSTVAMNNSNRGSSPTGELDFGLTTDSPTSFSRATELSSRRRSSNGGQQPPGLTPRDDPVPQWGSPNRAFV